MKGLDLNLTSVFTYMNLLIWQSKLLSNILPHQHVWVLILSKSELQPLQLLTSESSSYSLLLCGLSTSPLMLFLIITILSFSL